LFLVATSRIPNNNNNKTLEKTVPTERGKLEKEVELTVFFFWVVIGAVEAFGAPGQ
jgi:hypothetical protein